MLCEPWVLGTVSVTTCLAGLTNGDSGLGRINRCACDAIRVQTRCETASTGRGLVIMIHLGRALSHSLKVRPARPPRRNPTGSNTGTLASQSNSATSGITCELGRCNCTGVDDPRRNFHNQTSSMACSSCVKTSWTDVNRAGCKLVVERLSVISLTCHFWGQHVCHC